MTESYLTPPSSTRATLRQLAKRSRAFFEKYPNQSSYSRPFVRGEAWPNDVQCTRVTVAPIRPGQRIVMADDSPDDALWMQYDYDLIADTPAEDAAYASLRAISDFVERVDWDAAGEGQGQL